MIELGSSPFNLPPIPGIAGTSTSTSPAKQTDTFPPPEPLKLSDDELEEIADTIDQLYRDAVEARSAWSKRHQDYDLMFRGALDLRGDNAGPWQGSANLHVQMPYWAVDAYSTRLDSALWSQVPTVMGQPTEDDDEEVARNAANLVKWHLQPKRMNARAAWSRMSKTRCTHGRGIGFLPWAKDEYVYRVGGDVRYERDESGNILAGEDGLPVESETEPLLKRVTRYDGPLLVPLEWDDVIEPFEGTNLQPVTPANPLGADWIGIRQWESLSLIWKKRASSYPFIKDSETTDEWINEAPSQDRSGGGQSSAQNQARSKLQDAIEGRNRSQGTRSPRTKANPEFEILVWFMPWQVENEDGDKEDTECVFFHRVSPKRTLGAFRLTDLQWKNRRPLIELDFQTVGNRRLSMGIMELIADLSAELDTIHNMRMDVGFATNMPFFFYQATSTTDFSKITLRPGKGIPIDDVRSVVFPQLQSVTTFYYQEEQLLYSLVERVLGVTDLFLGVSPTRGAAARHATGFVGTQQEAMARTESIVASDAAQFSALCHMILEAELQFGPDERIIRLEGKEGPLTQRLTREELWFRGEYDFTLGANHGLYSSMMRQQQAQMLQGLAQVSPLINQDPGRRWEVENFIFHSYGFPDPQLFIGPKEAVSAGSAKEPEEENGEMDQSVHGVGTPAPVHPSDNDGEHLQFHMNHLNSQGFISMGRPNLRGHLAHIQATQAQMMNKQQMQQMAAQQAMMGGPAGMMSQPAEQPNARNVASLGGTEQAGMMGQMPQQGGMMAGRPRPGMGQQ